jgi:hypothetical protein
MEATAVEVDSEESSMTFSAPRTLRKTRLRTWMKPWRSGARSEMPKSGYPSNSRYVYFCFEAR